MNKGFTLVELLVIIVVVGILASLSVQVFEEFRKAAYKANVITTSKNILTAANAIVDDIPIGSSSLAHGYSASMSISATVMTENKTNYSATHNGLGFYMPSLLNNTDPNRLRYFLSITKNGGFGAGYQIYLGVKDCRVSGTYVIQANTGGYSDAWLSWGSCS